MVHQFEEYIYPGGFKKTVNIKILKTGDPNFPLSDRLSFIINIGAWLLFIIAAIAGFSAIWLPVMLLFFNFGNALGHVFFGSIKLRNYNPGFFSSLFLIIPFSTFVIINLVGENLLTAGDIVISIAIGALLGATLPLSIGGNYLMHRKK
jgi:hypothetical protein